MLGALSARSFVRCVRPLGLRSDAFLKFIDKNASRDGFAELPGDTVSPTTARRHDFWRETDRAQAQEAGWCRAPFIGRTDGLSKIITLETNALTLRVCLNPQFLAILPKFTLR